MMPGNASGIYSTSSAFLVAVAAVSRGSATLRDESTSCRDRRAQAILAAVAAAAAGGDGHGMAMSAKIARFLRGKLRGVVRRTFVMPETRISFSDIAVTRSNDALLLADMPGNRIKIVRICDGALLGSIGGRLRSPSRIHVARDDGMIFVVDSFGVWTLTSAFDVNPRRFGEIEFRAGENLAACVCTSDALVVVATHVSFHAMQYAGTATLYIYRRADAALVRISRLKRSYAPAKMSFLRGGAHIVASVIHQDQKPRVCVLSLEGEVLHTIDALTGNFYLSFFGCTASDEIVVVTHDSAIATFSATGAPLVTTHFPPPRLCVPWGVAVGDGAVFTLLAPDDVRDGWQCAEIH